MAKKKLSTKVITDENRLNTNATEVMTAHGYMFFYNGKWKKDIRNTDITCIIPDDMIIDIKREKIT